MNIQEDYVSFEIAKLLKEKRFDEEVTSFYFLNGTLSHGNTYSYCKMAVSSNSDLILAPTLQMAMKWLREVYKIYIDISPTYSEVEKTIHFIWQIFDSNYDGIGDCEIFYGKYETACEEAIIYCLENLI